MVLLIFFISNIHGMSFSANSNYRGVNLIYGSGTIHNGDLHRLKNIYRQVPKQRQTLLVLSSNGGELREGIALGEFIKQNRIGTAVRKNHTCASSCALAFLGGRSKSGSKLLILPRGSKLGFHKFHYRNRSYVNPAQVQSDMGALMSYVNYINAPRSLVTKMLNTDPKHLYWISNNDRSHYSIRVGYNRISFKNHSIKRVAQRTVKSYIRSTPPSSTSKYLLNQKTYIRYYLSKVNTLISANRGAYFRDNVALNDIYNRNWLETNLNYVYVKSIRLSKTNKVEAKVIYALKNGKRICSNNSYNLFQNNSGWSINSKSHKGCNHSSRKLLKRYASLLP